MGSTNSREVNFAMKVKSKLFNSERSSDVCFVVGEEKAKFYAHRAFLSIYSDVFEKMFFGGLKEKNYEIEVPDLDPAGFENMLKFIYGHDLIRGDGNGEGEMNPSDLWVTYLAADKYLIEELKSELVYGFVNRLNKFNVCLLYDQFLRLPFDDIGGLVFKEKNAFLIGVKKFIQAFSEDAFASESFTEIGEDALVSLLEFEFLNLSELDVLKACLRWVNAEVTRQGLMATAGNKQKVFAPIKPFIRFIDLGEAQLNELSELKEVLSLNELASLFLRLTNQHDQIAIECKTKRSKGRDIYEVKSNSRLRSNTRCSNLTVYLKASKKFCLTSIRTSFDCMMSGLRLKVFENYDLVPLAFLEFKKHLIDGRLCLEPGRALEMDRNIKYKFVFDFSEMDLEYLESSEIVGSYYYGRYFELSDFGKFHCIEALKCCKISDYESTKSA